MIREKEIPQDRMDYMIRARITDMLMHAERVYEQGDHKLAQTIIDLTFEFTAEIDQAKAILWLQPLRP